MEFTEIQELNNLIQLNKNQQKNKSSYKRHDTISSSINAEVVEIIKNILSVNQPSLSVAADIELYAMSYYSGLEKIEEMKSPFIQVERPKAKSELPTFDEVQIEEGQLVFTRKKIDNTNKARSSALGTRLSQVRSSKPSNAFEKKMYKLQVYYFGTSACKTVQYDADTLGETIIKKAISAYFLDTSLDQSKITSVSKEAYNLLMCDDGSHFPDNDLEPINIKRKIRDYNIDMLVMIRNNLVVQESPEVIAEFLAVDIYDRKSVVVVNQYGEEILKMNMDAEGIVAPLYQKVQRMGHQYHESKFYLAASEEASEEEAISRDTKVSELPNAVYIRLKRYADEAIIPTRNHKVSEDLEIQDIEAPMGLAQASMYEQFPVVKINKRGARQNRILGIDQIKIYNYDFQIRQEDKEIGFFNKMFGNNQNFGTKTPERLVSDIVKVKENKKQNMLIIEFSNMFSSKSLQFQIQPKIRRKIMQKLRVLTNNHNK